METEKTTVACTNCNIIQPLRWTKTFCHSCGRPLKTPPVVLSVSKGTFGRVGRTYPKADQDAMDTGGGDQFSRVN